MTLTGNVYLSIYWFDGGQHYDGGNRPLPRENLQLFAGFQIWALGDPKHWMQPLTDQIRIPFTVTLTETDAQKTKQILTSHSNSPQMVNATPDWSDNIKDSSVF